MSKGLFINVIYKEKILDIQLSEKEFHQEKEKEKITTEKRKKCDHSKKNLTNNFSVLLKNLKNLK